MKLMKALALSLFVTVGLCAQTGTQTTPDQLSPGTNVPVTPQTLYYVCVPIPGTGTPGKYACQVAVFPQATTSIVNGQLTITIPLTTGPQGLQGLQGVTGPAGTAGTAGAPGATGLQGLQGLQGVTGPAGTAGTAGAPGATGLQGLQGLQGVTGPAGTNGRSEE